MTKATKPRWSPEWSNDVFSVAERDLRWGRVRKLMRAAGVDLIVCLTNTNAHGRGSANHRYLTQLGDNSEEQTVAFPLEGDGDGLAFTRRGVALLELVRRHPADAARL